MNARTHLFSCVHTHAHTHSSCVHTHAHTHTHIVVCHFFLRNELKCNILFNNKHRG